jgi:hypothetical protein
MSDLSKKPRLSGSQYRKLANQKRTNAKLLLATVPKLESFFRETMVAVAVSASASPGTCELPSISANTSTLAASNDTDESDASVSGLNDSNTITNTQQSQD